MRCRPNSRVATIAGVPMPRSSRRSIVLKVSEASPPTGAAGCDYRERDRIAQLHKKLEVVARLRAVAVDRRHEQLACAAFLALARPRDGLAARLARLQRVELHLALRVLGSDPAKGVLTPIPSPNVGGKPAQVRLASEGGQDKLIFEPLKA